jgi:UDP-N-acetylmuramoyl-tripeptide--D-alanyl-D-alanine ligase
MRTELIERGGVRFLLDCYNANPTSMKLSLRTLRGIRAERRIAVLGHMAELGKRSRALHLAVGEEVAKNGIDVLLTVGEKAQAYAEGTQKWAKRNSKTPPVCISSEDLAEASGALRKLFQRGDLVLFKASRSVRLEDLIGMLG